MGRKAYLVTISFVTRVEVDVPDGCDCYSDGVFDAIYSEAEKHIQDKIHNGETVENIESIQEDLECPCEPLG